MDKQTEWNISGLENENKILQREVYELKQRIAELEAQTRWIPVSERLPEFNGLTASNHVEVAYRYKGGVHYMLKPAQYWKNYGWVYDFKSGRAIIFSDYGYVIDYWMPQYTLPETLIEPLEES